MALKVQYPARCGSNRRCNGGGGGAGAGDGMSGAGIFACEANAKIVTARRGRVGGAGSGGCKRKRGYTKGWRGGGLVRGRDFCAEGVAKIVTARRRDGN